MWRAMAREGMSRPTDAEADADLTLQATPPAPLHLAEASTEGLLARSCIERGDLATARARLVRIDAATDAFLSDRVPAIASVRVGR